MAAENNSNELRLTRLYDAPLKMVWDAWTDPAQAAMWWGPRGFTITTHQKDLRTGGTWNYTMHGPDGVDYPNKTTYLEVDPLRRLVYDHGANDTQPPIFRVTVLFSEVRGKTKMEMTMTMPSPEAARETKKFIKQAGGNATWDRLAEFLSDKTEKKDKFFINRSFDAEIETLFDVWTRKEHVAKWMPPTGFSMKFLSGQIEPDGKTFYVMSNDSGVKMYGRAHYREITRPDRLVYTQQFCDEKNEKATRHPFAPTWPETMLTTVTFTSEGKAQTRVTIEWEIYGEATDAERATFHQAKGGMTQGWTGSFDKLEEYLETI